MRERQGLEIKADDALLRIALAYDSGPSLAWREECIPFLVGVACLPSCNGLHDACAQKQRMPLIITK